MHSRILIWLNTIGCLVLVGLVVVQWRGELRANHELGGLRNELAAAQAHADEVAARCQALERDLSVLKESAQQSSDALNAMRADAATKDARLGELDAALAEANTRLAEWRTAIAQRDEQITKLNAENAEARRRLDDAIAKLKAAGAR